VKKIKCHLIAQEQFANHNQLTLKVVRTLEHAPNRRLWLLRCTDCGQYYLKGYEQIKDWADGEGKVQVKYRPITDEQVREADRSLKRAWKMARSRPYILWDEEGRLRWRL
jgi:hypothetical protein